MNHNKNILGIHIDDDFLRIVHLGRTENGLQVHHWTTESLDAGVVKDGLIIDEQAISRRIRDYIKTRTPRPRKAIISLPCSTVRLKPSEYPAQADEQLQQQIEDKVKKYTVFGHEETVFDYCTVQGNAQTANKRTVLEAITARRISDACLMVARQAGLDLVGIEPAVLPIMKIAIGQSPTESDAVVLLLTLDSSSGNVTVLKNNTPQLCRNLTVGLTDISQDRNGSNCLTGQMKPILEFAHSLADSQQLVLKVAASCGSEGLGAILGQIRQNFSDVMVEQIDTTQIAEKLDIRDADSGELPILAFASALAALNVFEFAGELNLVSQESLARHKTQKEMSLAGKAIAATVLLFVTAIIPLEMKIKGVEASFAEIESKIIKTAPQEQTLSGIRKQVEQLKAKQSAYAAVTRELTHTPWPRTLRVIGNAIPDDVRIVAVSTNNLADLTMIGEARSENCVYAFARDLQQDDLIDRVKVEEIEYDDSNAKPVVDYRITCKMRLSESDS